MRTEHFTSKKQTRVSIIGDISKARHIWIALHGYGQLAPYFLRNFQFLRDQGHAVLAPEAQSRFYLEGFKGRVGATWMTKEDRLTDIEDYVNYLDSVYQNYIPFERDIKIHLLGFSQGAATASRWIAHGKAQFDSLVLYAGLFPEDLPFESSHLRFSQIPVSLVYGKEDQFRDDEKLLKRMKPARDFNIDYRIIEFNGKHQITGEALSSILNSMPGLFK